MRAILLIFFLGLFGRDALAFSDTEALESVRNAIIEQLLGGDEVRLKRETPVDVAFVKKIAPVRLGHNVVVSTTKVSGADFYFESSEHENHVGVWVFFYRNNAAAIRNARAIKGFCKGGCFRSKLLTVFSKVIVDNKLIIIFTESSGVENIAGFVAKSAPQLFDK